MLAYCLTHPVKTGRPHKSIINEQFGNYPLQTNHKYMPKKVLMQKTLYATVTALN